MFIPTGYYFWGWIRFFLRMIKCFLLPVFVFLIWIPVQGEHPIHVSITEIEYDEKDKALEIVIRVFMDDLEIALRKRYQEPDLDIMQPQKKSLDEMMGDYLKDHVSIRLDNKSQTHRYLGHERDGEAFVFFVEVSKIKKWNTISIANSILMEIYDDQSNLIHVTVAGKVRSLRLTKRNQSGQLTF
jgi:hypothetical protein